MAGASGDIFEIVENADYKRSAADTKNHKANDNFTDYFDYFAKTVQIDGKVFDLYINVKKQYYAKDGYTYTIKIADNKKTPSARAVTLSNRGQGFLGQYNTSSSSNSQASTKKSSRARVIDRSNEELDNAKKQLNEALHEG